MASLRQSTVSKWSWMSPSYPSAVRISAKWMMYINFTLFVRSHGHRSHIETLGERFKGYVVGIHSGDDKKFSLKQGILTHNTMYLPLNKERSCYRTKEREGMCVYSEMHCRVQSEYSWLDYWKQREGDSWTNRCYCALVVGLQKS